MQPLFERYPDRLVVDAGGWAERINPDRPALRSELLLDGLRRLGLQVANLSVRDLGLGPQALEAIQDSIGLQLVSANISTADGAALVRPYVLLRTRVGGREIGIGVTGVTSDGRGFAPAWPDTLLPRIGDPAEAARRTFELLRPQSDLQILLAALPVADLEKLAAELPGYDLLVCGTGDSVDPPRTGFAPVVVAPGTKCKHLAYATLRPAAPDGYAVVDAAVRPLDAGIVEDGEMARHVLELKARLGDGTAAAPAGGAGGSPAHPGAGASVARPGTLH